MEAVDRFYRSYSNYLRNYDNDSLFILLNSLHSLGDKLKTDNNIDLLTMDEFVTLKTIRNHLHHQADIHNISTSIPIEKISPILIDLAFMCLLYTSDINDAINDVQKKYRNKTKDIINNTVHFYGNVVNISHVIFNMAAKLMVVLEENGIAGKSDEYQRNYDCMMFDINNGHSITVSGKIYGHIGNIKKIGDILLNEMQSNN